MEIKQKSNFGGTTTEVEGEKHLPSDPELRNRGRLGVLPARLDGGVGNRGETATGKEGGDLRLGGEDWGGLAGLGCDSGARIFSHLRS
jgi:hypothetical protein